MTKRKPPELHKKRGRRPKKGSTEPVIPEIRDNSGQVETKNKTGRPPKLKADPETLKQVKLLGQLHCTIVEAARFLGVDDETFRDFLAREPEALKTWETSRADGLVKLRAAQFKKALAGNPEMLKWMGKQLLNQQDKGSIELTGKDGGPISSVSREMTPQEAAEAYAATLAARK